MVRVTREWEMARSSFYHQRALAARPDRVLRRRGPKTAWSDAALLGKIREVLAASPFYGEGHRKVWARLRFQEVRTSKARVLRLMREAQLLAPSRTLPKPENPHTGTIITARPNEVWASDHTLTATVEEGQVTVFVAVDHCTTECVGLHAAKKATRFEALEPLRQAVRDYCGGFRAGAAAGIRNRHDHGSQYMSDDYQAEIAFLGMESSPSFVRQPECNGCVERFIRTLKEQLLWVQGVPERRGTAMRAGGISRALQPALDRPAPGLPHASPGSPAAPCTRSCCMNTLNSVSKKSGAKQDGQRHMKFDRKELTEFVQANPNQILMPVVDGDGVQIGFIPSHALSVYLQF